MFTVHLSNTEKKKSILINQGDSLHFVLEKICIARGISIDTLTVLDGTREKISLYKCLSEVEGRCVYLCYPNVNDIPKTRPPELPKIRHPSEYKDEFIFPLPVSPVVLDFQKSLGESLQESKQSKESLHESKQSNRKSIGKSLSTSLIPRALTPRSEKEKVEKQDISLSGEVPLSLSSRSSSDTSSLVVKDEKRKSRKSQHMTKRSSEINSKALNQGKRTKSDLQVPPFQNRAPLIGQTAKAKSELQVPSIHSNISNTELLITQRSLFDSKKGKAHSTKSATPFRSKENIPL